MAVAITRTDNPAAVNASSFVATYSSANIGTASDDRVIVVTVGTDLASSTPSACTIDFGSGDSTMNIGTSASLGNVRARMFYLHVPTGTTATIKVTFSSTSPTSSEHKIAIYAVTGANLLSQGVDTSTDMDATDPLTTGSTVIPTNGGMLAVVAGATQSDAKTWANLTEDIDTNAGALRFTTAFSTSSGTATRTCTGATNGEDGAMAWMIFSDSSLPLATAFASSVTSMPVAMPLAINSGEKLLAFSEVRTSGTWTPPSGWNEDYSQLGGLSTGELTMFSKTADGTEDYTTQTWTASTGTTAVWQVIKVNSWHGTTAPEAATSSGDSVSVDPPNLSPSWGSENTLWIAVAGHTAISAAAFTAEPSGYSNFQNNGASTGGSACSIATAVKTATASSEDPGTFTAGGSNRYWACFTVGVRPAGAGVDETFIGSVITT